MIKVILIDDEPLARGLVREYLRDFQNFEIVAECGDGFEAVKAIQHHKPELIFLDIQMPKINGFETLELLEHKPSVIFTTAFDEYALKAFEQNAIDYLLKPFSAERFSKAVTKFKEGVDEKAVDKLAETPQKFADEAQRIVVKNGSNILVLPVSQVALLEAFDDYVKIFHEQTFFLKKKTMTYYEQILDSSKFIRVHRSFIINLDFLTRIEPIDKNNSIALLTTGARVPISKAGYLRLKTMINL